MLPAKTVDVPSVAELPRSQKTLHACAPLTSRTRLADAVVSVEPAWKTKTALGSPCASSASSPVSASDDPDRYTPGASVVPPRSAGAGTGGVRPAASS